MFRPLLALSILVFLGSLTSPTPACSLCTGVLSKDTLGHEMERASLIIYGYAGNPRLSTENGALPGSGATDFHIEKIVKNTTGAAQPNVLTLQRYVPVLDTKNPPKFLVFCTDVKGKLDPYLGRQTKSLAVVDYLENAKVARAAGKVAALQYYAKFLDHADELIAEDAFLEFVRSSDEEVGQAAKKLQPAKFRALLHNSKLDADRASLFAFLLGNCGDATDAGFLRKRIDGAKSSEEYRALDGVLGGYIAMRPKEGWKLVQGILADAQPNFLKKLAALRAVRFYMGWQPAQSKEVMLAAYRSVIPNGEMSDLAIEDLRRWKMWDLTPVILAQYGKTSHDAPIVKRCILRYALSCPAPEAQRFVEKARERDGEIIRDLAQALEFEKKQ